MNTLTQQEADEQNQKRADKSSENNGAGKKTMMRGLGQLFGYEHTKAEKNMTGFEDDSEARMKGGNSQDEKKAADQKKVQKKTETKKD